MSASLIVATILVFGWNLTLILTALVTGTGPFQNREQRTQEMSRSLKSVQAEVGKPELDARTEAWKRELGIGTESVQSRITETQQEVTVQAPYAEASVAVSGDDGEEVRRCTVCMN